MSATPSPSASPLPSPLEALRGQSPASTVSTAVAEFLQRAEDDDIVCAFGPDYFRGAAFGSFGGCLFLGALSIGTFRHLKADQREVDFLAGLRRGQRNRHFSAWTVLRGLRTQPMLTVSCLALSTTTAMKCIKCYLASRRCREFYQDDVEFALLHEESRRDPKAAAMLEAIEREAEATVSPTPLSPLAIKSAAVAELHKRPSPTPTTTESASAPAVNMLKPGTSVKELLNANDASLRSAGNSKKLIHRCPTFADGVAVAFLGSVLDCYVPQKPVQKYYNMHAGVW